MPLTARLPILLLQHVGAALGGAQMGNTWISFIVLCARAFSFERICSLRLFFTLFTVILRVAMTKRHMQVGIPRFSDPSYPQFKILNTVPAGIEFIT